ncbi:hypothetical protein TcWFU_002265 [Taenia crassiceps]|uniref:Uncharacterized protein n=1 Tax=Taenia crassiceps TaxID=6207 RepID=A0ABR4Q2R9_9CEST
MDATSADLARVAIVAPEREPLNNKTAIILKEIPCCLLEGVQPSGTPLTRGAGHLKKSQFHNGEEMSALISSSLRPLHASSVHWQSRLCSPCNRPQHLTSASPRRPAQSSILCSGAC